MKRIVSIKLLLVFIFLCLFNVLGYLYTLNPMGALIGSAIGAVIGYVVSELKATEE
jgi:hypothetical protein